MAVTHINVDVYFLQTTYFGPSYEPLSGLIEEQNFKTAI